MLELEPLELDLELDEDEDRDPDPDPLDPEPESLERDFLRFFLVLRERRAVGEPECPFTGLLLRSNLLLSLYWSVLPTLSFQE